MLINTLRGSHITCFMKEISVLTLRTRSSKLPAHVLAGFACAERTSRHPALGQGRREASEQMFSATWGSRCQGRLRRPSLRGRAGGSESPWALSKAGLETRGQRVVTSDVLPVGTPAVELAAAIPELVRLNPGKSSKSRASHGRPEMTIRYGLRPELVTGSTKDLKAGG